MASAPVLPAPSVEPWNLYSRGRVGMICLILTDIAFFSIFVIAYIFYIGKSLNGPYPSDVLSPPLLNTACLLSSSITVVIALRALQKDNVRMFGLWWLITLLLGVEFLTGTGMEWHDLIYNHGLTLRTNLFGTTFYSLVGLHALHVTIGVIMILIVMLFTVTGHMGRRHAERVELLSWYWHFVDGVWVVVFLTVYVFGR